MAEADPGDSYDVMEDNNTHQLFLHSIRYSAMYSDGH